MTKLWILVASVALLAGCVVAPVRPYADACWVPAITGRTGSVFVGITDKICGNSALSDTA